MDTYTLHLAIAAMVGASFVAVSAYYVHHKTLTQLLEFVRAVDLDRDQDRDRDQDDDRSKAKRGQSQCRKKGRSLPDVAAAAAEVDGVEEGMLGIPVVLPCLNNVHEGNKQSVLANSNRRAGNQIRPRSPESLAASASAFERVEGSDNDETLPNDTKLDNSYLHTNGDLIPSADEVEVYNILQKCLELRRSYVFNEEIVPWEKEVITDPVRRSQIQTLLDILLSRKQIIFFQMVDGVAHVNTNQESMERIFPLVFDTTISTDLHYILRVISAGKHPNFMPPSVNSSGTNWEFLA